MTKRIPRIANHQPTSKPLTDMTGRFFRHKPACRMSKCNHAFIQCFLSKVLQSELVGGFMWFQPNWRILSKKLLVKLDQFPKKKPWKLVTFFTFKRGHPSHRTRGSNAWKLLKTEAVTLCRRSIRSCQSSESKCWAFEDSLTENELSASFRMLMEFCSQSGPFCIIQCVRSDWVRKDVLCLIHLLKISNQNLPNFKTFFNLST